MYGEHESCHEGEGHFPEQFAGTPSLKVLELDEEHGCRQRDLYQGTGKMATMLQLEMPDDAVHTCTTKDINDDQPAKGRETSNMILVHEQTWTCGR